MATAKSIVNIKPLSPESLKQPISEFNLGSLLPHTEKNIGSLQFLPYGRKYYVMMNIIMSIILSIDHSLVCMVMR
jgi:hypothetical protein